MSTNESSAAPSRPSDAATRKRGSGFPVVPLPEAARTLSEAGQYGADFTQSAFASYLGLTSTNSGAFRQKLAAFRDWKLISYSGDRIVLTELGRRIALASDPAAEHEALQEAFFGCRLFGEIYNDQAKGRPLDLQQLAKSAIITWGVSAGSRSQFIKSFSESAEAAGVAQLQDDDRIVLLPRTSSTPDTARTEVQPDLPDQTTTTTPRPPHTMSTPVVLRQVWPIATGELIFEVRSRNPLPASGFAAVADVAHAIESLAATLGPAESSETQS